MPVRSLSSSVLKWPDRETVDAAAREWAASRGSADRRVLRIGYFGSYARGTWGVGSDLDVIVLVSHAPKPIERRAVEWDTGSLPVPVDLLIYTEDEWGRMRREGARFARTVDTEAVWVYEAAADA